MEPLPCPACGSPLQLVWVHGHGQCSQCGVVVEPCCGGSGDEAEKAFDGPGCPIVGEDLATAFELLGARTVTRDSLVHELATRHGVTYDVAMRAITQAVQRGRIGWDRERDLCRWIPAPEQQP